ncbi:c-type cytochrome [Flavihumibacter petaseus]|uniref:Cytochrome c domain-containing protein n=1 Tax=Flavihumibacter petaseus NBRC 106054 TaxID=1220578 RepID=A0A0E9MUK4_9BACT|nr:cytochrome c [Flavihumibacter petaseus]GAO41168.1 hypothetical protein FPE01S_01_01800 [Flavihumibacter petaseus NBRC 106054]
MKTLHSKLITLFGSLFLCAVAYTQTPTYYDDIEPIIMANCAPCHKPGEAGPFSLLTYQDVAKRASFIRDVVQSRFMPPWKADNSYVHFANDRSLSDKDIQKIVQWVDAKAPAGKRKSGTPAPEQNIVTGTTYPRKPDMVLQMSDSFVISGGNYEQYVIFKLPFELKDSFNVEAIEFIANNKKLVHHVNYAIHPVLDESIDMSKSVPLVNLTDGNRRLFDQYQPYRKTITYYGGWIPGARYESYPGDFGWVMPKRGVILMTVHFSPIPENETFRGGVNLFFKKTKVKRPVKVVSFGSGGIGEGQIDPIFYIKANEKQTFTLDVSNPNEDQSLLYVWPHMHLIGKVFKAYAITPAKDTVRLVNIPDWDFRWQEVYRFEKPVRIPKGSVIHIEGTYDNTADNPFNPNSPPKTIFSRGDMKTTDEMMTLMVIFVPYQPGDENINLKSE